jgi:catalase
MAIKVLGVPGDKILEDERLAQTQDFLLINYPVFFNKDPREYVKLMQALNSSNPLGVASAAIPLGLSGAEILIKIIRQKIANPALARYWSETPYRLGSDTQKQAIKFSAKPCVAVDNTQPPANPDPNYLRLALVDTLAKGDVCYEFLVQPRPSAAFDVEDSMVEWQEAEAPFYKVATITIPKQVFDTPAQRNFCDNTSFTPWHSLPEHRPLGAANRIRRVVYQTISKLRHQLNNTPRTEPTGNELF